MRPKVGVAVIIERDETILLGQRLNSHGAEQWAPPGGHLEYSETPEDCAKREVLEETGLVVISVDRGGWTNDFFKKESKHYVTLFMHAKVNGGVAEVMEPTKCRRWQWFSKQALPSPLFLPIKNYWKLL
jgi:8-oxo-dGTP diphosphatase